MNQGEHSMVSTTRTHTTQPDLGTTPAPGGPASRRRPLRILFVHTDAAQMEQCLQELKRAHFDVRSDVVSAPEQFVKFLRSKYYDVVLVQYPTPNWQGPQALEMLRLKERQIPLILLTDKMALETVAALITEGADDCVEIDHIGHLPVAIRRTLSENNLREERDLSEKKLRHSEANYRALVGNLTYGMCRCNFEGKFLDVNQALVTMLGYSSREELLLVDLANDVLCDSAKRVRLLGHSFETNGTDPLEIDWKRMDGSTLRVRLSGREVSNEDEIESYEIIVEDVTQQRKLEDHLRQQAAKDPLTGLANYRQLVETLDTEIKRSERTSREFALLFLDLDGLKKINDRFGHLIGSQALCRMADVLCICSRNIDTAARFGGDEFALVLPETGATAANFVARRIRESLANDGREPKLSVSIGIAVYPKDGESIDALLGAADVSLYSVKGRPRNSDPSAKPKRRDLSRKTAVAGKASR
jgi:diguanylate cyclase (GGDEF)-like protein/PAS domain S-box-containing protein